MQYFFRWVQHVTLSYLNSAYLYIVLAVQFAIGHRRLEGNQSYQNLTYILKHTKNVGTDEKAPQKMRAFHITYHHNVKLKCPFRGRKIFRPQNESSSDNKSSQKPAVEGVNIGSVVSTSDDFETLEGNQLINDNIINAFIHKAVY